LLWFVAFANMFAMVFGMDNNECMCVNVSARNGTEVETGTILDH
jgi:hypothetical protein